MSYYWTKLDIYNHDSFVGSTYSNKITREGWEKDISKEFGNNWTRYNVG